MSALSGVMLELLAVALLLLAGGGMMYAMSGTVMVHVGASLLAMVVLAVLLVQANEARNRTKRIVWSVGAANMLLVFVYYAATVIFRPPIPKTALPCGGVHFVDEHIPGMGHSHSHDEL